MLLIEADNKTSLCLLTFLSLYEILLFKLEGERKINITK